MTCLAASTAGWTFPCCSAVSEHLYRRSLRIAAPVQQVVDFFNEGNAWYRINPEWEVLAFRPEAEGQYLKVRYERSEQEAVYRRRGNAAVDLAGGRVELVGDPPRNILLRLAIENEKMTFLEFSEDFDNTVDTARRAELNLWLDACAGYLALGARRDRRARLMRWLLDRFWLRMSPTSRRVSLMIIGMEGLALLFFISLLIIYRLLG